jgi:hypothetical protein
MSPSRVSLSITAFCLEAPTLGSSPSAQGLPPPQGLPQTPEQCGQELQRTDEYIAYLVSSIDPRRLSLADQKTVQVLGRVRGVQRLHSQELWILDCQRELLDRRRDIATLQGMVHSLQYQGAYPVR